MKYAVIDIGSNSMRLTVYDAEKTSFKILFREKVMAGLAGYVEKGRLTAEGIACACSGLLEFRETLEVLGIDGACVFATASLRNVTNTQQAVAEISAATGYDVEVLSGEDEAALGYLGAMCELNMTCGVLTDIGGASTEVTLFRDGAVVSADSFPIGSLKLYRECVKKILPGKKAMDRICAQVRIALKDVDFDALTLRDEWGDTISYQMDYQWNRLTRTGTVSACEDTGVTVLGSTMDATYEGDSGSVPLLFGYTSVQYLRDGYYPDPYAESENLVFLCDVRYWPYDPEEPAPTGVNTRAILEIEDCINAEALDVDGDGEPEVAVRTRWPEKPYTVYDYVDGEIVETWPDTLPEEILEQMRAPWEGRW